MSSSGPEANLFLLFTSRFDELKIPYMVTGSVATILYGAIRLTHDVDMVALLDFATAQQLPKLFPAEEFYCPPSDVITMEMARDLRGHFNLIHIETGFKADVYLRGRDPFHFWGLERSRRVQVGSISVNVAPPEYVIVRKLEYFREGGSEKHLRDIHETLRVSKGQVDLEELRRLVLERELDESWRALESLSNRTRH
jgi:hypothetical protein